jgi:hypothetical protein
MIEDEETARIAMVTTIVNCTILVAAILVVLWFTFFA